MAAVDERLQDYSSELVRDFSGEIRFDRLTRLLYSTDASIYQIEPLGVLLPRNRDDVAAAVALAARHSLPILCRGAGTSLAGQTVGAAVVIDFSKYMNRILEVNVEDRCARIEPGVVLDQLNARLSKDGLQFGPDVSTSSRATLGGMIGNNSCGARSIRYGKTIDHVREMRVLLPKGGEAHFSDLGPVQWRMKAAQNGPVGALYRAVDRLVGLHRDEILLRFPKVMRRVGGYNLDSFLSPEGRNLSRMIVGSEGTLATLTEAVVGTVPLPNMKALTILHFPDLVAAMEATGEILTLDPVAIELVDKMLLDLTRLQPAFANKMSFIEGNPEAILVVEFYGDTREELDSKLANVDRLLHSRRIHASAVHATSPRDQANVWAIRKAGLGLLSSMRGEAKPIAFVEDTAVPPENLGSYVRRFQQVLAQNDIRAGYYGHASVGCLHIRPIINLKEASQVERMAAVAGAVKDLVVEFEGAMSGEHGDGISRSHWNRELFGDRLYEAFREVKQTFDPAGIMNPGKIVDAPAMTEHLRYGAAYSVRTPEPRFDFAREGGLAAAIEQCNGMGACRKVGSGTMCPSYMATREEEHSTRGRANVLRAAISGRLSGFTDPEVLEALDLCLECKACKTECPANVDMAKLKSEFLSHYYSDKGFPLRSIIFGNIALVSRIGSATAPLSNWILSSAVSRHTLQRWLGIPPERRLPPFSRQTFRHWLNRHRHTRGNGAPAEVVLFTDTYANYNEPAVGRAALKLLESTGARVSVPEVVCCGRPMISKGLLDQARENARKNVALLTPYVESGAYVVGCEPSCILTLKDEYPDLLRSAEAKRLAERVLLLEEYLVLRSNEGTWHPEFNDAPLSIVAHGHCHQKSLVGTSPLLELLRMPPQFSVREIDSGCCGMAGSFGYEKEHYRISMQIGELSLFPAIRAASPDTRIVASGISCRQQIRHATGRKAIHFAEPLAEALSE